MSNGTPNAAAFLLVGNPVAPLDLSIAGFNGCIVYPSLAGSILARIGSHFLIEFIGVGDVLD